MKFRMVDRILDWEARRTIRGVKAVSFEEYQLRQRLGDAACLPESLLLESLLQLGNWLIILSSDFVRMGLAVQWDEVRFPGRLRAGRRLQMEVTVRSWRDDGIVFDGAASDGERMIASGKRCLAVPVALADYQDPDDLRVLFSQIHGGEDRQTNETDPCRA